MAREAGAGSGAPIVDNSNTPFGKNPDGSALQPASFTNPPFDRRLMSANPWFPGIAGRGSMVQNREYVHSIGGVVPCKLQFLYNPLGITYGHVSNNGMLDVSALTVSQQKTPLNVFGGGTTINFQLLFDRSYDVIDGVEPTGVVADTDAFYNMVKMPSGIGFLTTVPIDVYFGAAVDITKFIVSPENYPAPVSTLHFHGFVSGATVGYTHFTRNMVPTRAVIDINMTQIISEGTKNSQFMSDAAAADLPGAPKPPAAPKALPKPEKPPAPENHSSKAAAARIRIKHAEEAAAKQKADYDKAMAEYKKELAKWKAAQ